MNNLRVVIADDHPAILVGVRQVLASAMVNVVAVAGNSSELIEVLDNESIDILFTDYAMPGGKFGDGLGLIALLVRRYPDMRIAVLTMIENAGIVRALMLLGVRCVFSKSDDINHLIPAMHVLQAGGTYFSPSIHGLLKQQASAATAGSVQTKLSPRESEVVRLYAAGMTIGDIAARFCRSKQTISSQKASAMRKLGVASDSDLFRYVMEVGLYSS